MKTKIKKLLLQYCSNAFNYFFVKTKLYNPDGVRVLCYHNISLDNAKEDIFTVSLEEFKKQMQFLYKERYSVFSMEEFLNIHDLNKKYPKKSIVLTFDDGFKSFYNLVLPILRKYNYPATIFITTDFINTNETYMTWEEVKKCANDKLINVGGHGVSHIKLTEVPFDITYKEIIYSKEILENILQKQIKVFAYPYGVYNNMIRNLVQKLEFKGAFTTKFGINSYTTDPYSFKRITIFNSDFLSVFKTKLAGAYDWRGWLNF
ncbi:MAG: polysaccharide deacetylase family protein [Parcubacteria group bacterium]|nr:polysaccharide deacetylase family protein [Parcubacteria group bacterium]